MSISSSNFDPAAGYFISFEEGGIISFRSWRAATDIEWKIGLENRLGQLKYLRLSRDEQLLLLVLSNDTVVSLENAVILIRSASI